jgi:hypothetical protein
MEVLETPVILQSKRTLAVLKSFPMTLLGFYIDTDCAMVSIIYNFLAFMKTKKKKKKKRCYKLTPQYDSIPFFLIFYINTLSLSSLLPSQIFN